MPSPLFFVSYKYQTLINDYSLAISLPLWLSNKKKRTAISYKFTYTYGTNTGSTDDDQNDILNVNLDWTTIRMKSIIVEATVRMKTSTPTPY